MHNKYLTVISHLFAVSQHTEIELNIYLAKVVLRSGSRHLGGINSFSMDYVIKDFPDGYEK